MTLADRIKFAREQAGLTQVQLAKAVGISQPSIHELESGRTKQFRASTLLKVAKFLGQSPEWLANGEGEASVLSTPAIKSPDEEELLTSFRSLPPLEKKVILRMVRALVAVP